MPRARLVGQSPPTTAPVPPHGSWHHYQGGTPTRFSDRPYDETAEVSHPAHRSRKPFLRPLLRLPCFVLTVSWGRIDLERMDQALCRRRHILDRLIERFF